MIVWEPTYSLIVLLISGLILSRSIFSAIAFSIFGLICAADLAVIIDRIISLNVNKPLLVFFSSLCLFISLLYAHKEKKKIPLSHWVGLGIFILGTITSQIVTRIFGLTSVAFGDGHTIMMLSQSFQNESTELISGTKALKRGFGFPALQSFGFDGEYLVGFEPIFFMAAVILTLYIVRLLSPNFVGFYSVSSVVLVIVFSTEAILRHLYLMNTYSIAWLITAFFLYIVWKYFYRIVNLGDIATIFLAFGTIAFLRIDYIALFSPYILCFILISARKSIVLSIFSLFTVAVPAWLWMTFAVKDFPFFGSAGPTVLVISGFLLGILIIFTQRKLDKPIQPLTNNLLLVTSGIILFTIFVITDTLKSLRNIIINLFFGEGLWGISSWVILILILAGLITKRFKEMDSFMRAAIRLFLSSLIIYVFTKFLDGDSLWQTRTGWSRVGFGDSLNRTVTTWLPFFFIPLVSLWKSQFSTFDANRKGTSGKKP